MQYRRLTYSDLVRWFSETRTRDTFNTAVNILYRMIILQYLDFIYIFPENLDLKTKTPKKN